MTDAEKIQLRTQHYDPEEARALLDQKDCGAVLWFEGVMKEVLADGTRVSQLDWDAYQSMAIKSLNDLRDRAIEEFELNDLILIHRIDTQFPGDLIMTLGVSSARRKGAIAAIGWFMDELKQLAPLWKKEKLAGGNERWVEGEKTTD